MYALACNAESTVGVKDELWRTSLSLPVPSGAQTLLHWANENGIEFLVVLVTLRGAYIDELPLDVLAHRREALEAHLKLRANGWAGKDGDGELVESRGNRRNGGQRLRGLGIACKKRGSVDFNWAPHAS